MNRTFALLLVTLAATVPRYAIADDAAALAALRAGCQVDVQSFCANVAPGGGRILACLKEHRNELSDQCKQAAKAAGLSGNTAPSASSHKADSNPNPAALPATDPASLSPPGASAAKPAAASSHRSSSTDGAVSASYLRLKKVQIIDPGAANVYSSMPALDLLIPSDWTFKGTVNFAGGKGGCFADLMAVSWEAKSPDGAMSFQGAPNFSWQYTNDQTELRKLNDPSRRQLGAGGKPCPVAQPMKAEQYFRQNLLPSIPNGAVISIAPFPELNQMVRQQVGLSSPSSASANGTVQTEAIRARISFQKDGKPMESWITVALITRAFQLGRGGFWDCRAVDVMAFNAAPGTLDANDKFFKVMVTSLRPEVAWQSTSNSVIAKFYQAEAQKESQQDQIIADFQRKVIQTINATTANAQRGANQASFGEDQVIRGVQTFRDPATGKTMELSNQYDHAWLNGSNEYVMSDDPNFRPNSQLSGSWSELQVVHPSP